MSDDPDKVGNDRDDPERPNVSTHRNQTRDLHQLPAGLVPKGTVAISKRDSGFIATCVLKGGVG
jgi:hypothetical protein